MTLYECVYAEEPQCKISLEPPEDGTCCDHSGRWEWIELSFSTREAAATYAQITRLVASLEAWLSSPHQEQEQQARGLIWKSWEILNHLRTVLPTSRRPYHTPGCISKGARDV
jgi:hypothetical protein